MANKYVAERIGGSDYAVYPVREDGRVLRGRMVGRFATLFHALLFIRALGLADAGAPIMDGIIDDD